MRLLVSAALALAAATAHAAPPLTVPCAPAAVREHIPPQPLPTRVLTLPHWTSSWGLTRDDLVFESALLHTGVKLPDGTVLPRASRQLPMLAAISPTKAMPPAAYQLQALASQGKLRLSIHDEARERAHAEMPWPEGEECATAGVQAAGDFVRKAVQAAPTLPEPASIDATLTTEPGTPPHLDGRALLSALRTAPGCDKTVQPARHIGGYYPVFPFQAAEGSAPRSVVRKLSLISLQTSSGWVDWRAGALRQSLGNGFCVNGTPYLLLPTTDGRATLFAFNPKTGAVTQETDIASEALEGHAHSVALLPVRLDQSETAASVHFAVYSTKSLSTVADDPAQIEVHPTVRLRLSLANPT